MVRPLPFGEWRPDLLDLNEGYTSDLLNAKPKADGYGPIPSLAAFSQAIGADARGAFYALNVDGTVTIFAGTETDLWKLDNTDLTWDNVSLGGGPYAALGTDANWSFTQFGSFVVATHAGIDIQVFQLGVSSAFANLAGSPPRCARVSVINYFLVLAGLVANPNRVQWSGLGNITIYNGTQSSGFQDMPSGGAVVAVEGSDDGVIVQENRLAKMIFAPGDPRIFLTPEMVFGVGTRYASAVVNAQGTVYFPSNMGFVKATASGGWALIGKERVDKTFAKSHDEDAKRLVIGAVIPNEPVVCWAYKSRVGGADNRFDRIIAFDYALDRWYPFATSGQFLVALAQPGMTLDAIPDVLDDMEGSLDDYSAGSLPKFAAIDALGRVAFWQGENLEATIGTAEQSAISGRMFCTGFWPITDASAAFCSVGGRESLEVAPAWRPEQARTAKGIAPAKLSTRHLRGRLRIPAGATWTGAKGLQPEVQPDGGY